jgi:hypothetical protein
VPLIEYFGGLLACEQMPFLHTVIQRKQRFHLQHAQVSFTNQASISIIIKRKNHEQLSATKQKEILRVKNKERILVQPLHG